MNFMYLAVSCANGLLANGHTFRTILCFTSFVGTFNLTYGFLAFYLTNSILGFLANSPTLGRLTNGLANCLQLLKYQDIWGHHTSRHKGDGTLLK